jgi:hypothetical protein
MIQDGGYGLHMQKDHRWAKVRETRVHPQGSENLHQQAFLWHKLIAESLPICDPYSDGSKRPTNAKSK